MGNNQDLSTQNLEKILLDHIAGKRIYPGEEILSACEELAKRETSDAVGVYRRLLTDLFPEDMKKDL